MLEELKKTYYRLLDEGKDSHALTPFVISKR